MNSGNVNIGSSINLYAGVRGSAAKIIKPSALVETARSPPAMVISKNATPTTQRDPNRSLMDPAIKAKKKDAKGFMPKIIPIWAFVRGISWLISAKRGGMQKNANDEKK